MGWNANYFLNPSFLHETDSLNNEFDIDETTLYFSNNRYCATGVIGRNYLSAKHHNGIVINFYYYFNRRKNMTPKVRELIKKDILYYAETHLQKEIDKIEANNENN